MPKVSVVILNWNGKRFLGPCLRSFEHVSYPAVEIVVVDNNSSDGSQAYIKKNFPKVRLIANKKNYGFADGNNIGWKAATGDYILFLNNDTVVTPNFLQTLIGEYKRDHHLGCIQPQMRVLNQKEILDTAGSYLTFTGFLYHYGYRKPYVLPMYQVRREIFSAKGACMLIPTAVLRKIDGFDEDFFIFFEETDLCHRIWLAGYSVLYQPDASIFHLAGGDTTDTYNRARRIYLTFKNMNYSYMKNFGLANMLMIFPVFVVFQVFLFGYFLLSGNFGLAGAMARAYAWILQHLPVILRKREKIQKMRVVSDRALNAYIMHNPDWYYYYCLLFGAQQYKDTLLPSAT